MYDKITGHGREAEWVESAASLATYVSKGRMYDTGHGPPVKETHTHTLTHTHGYGSSSTLADISLRASIVSRLWVAQSLVLPDSTAMPSLLSTRT